MKVNQGKAPKAWEGQLGERAQVIPCLNTSLTFRDENNRIQFVKRYYSVKQKLGEKSFKLRGHQTHFTMTDVTFTVQRGAQAQVRQSNVKTPHAFLNGPIAQIGERDIEELKSAGWVHISYDPFKTDDFVVCPDEHLPGDVRACQALPKILKCDALYAYPTGILVLNPTVAEPTQQELF